MRCCKSAFSSPIRATSACDCIKFRYCILEHALKNREGNSSGLASSFDMVQIGEARAVLSACIVVDEPAT
jgi:hypothetical protein